MDVIIYTSNAGSTARYAKMLGQALSLPVYTADEAAKTVADGTSVIYLGWIMAGEIKGCKAAAKRYRLRAVCGVGLSPTGTQTDALRQKNAVPEEVPVFSLQGSFDINKLHGVYKLLMRAMQRTAAGSSAQKADRTPAEDEMLTLMLHGGDRVDENNLQAVQAWYAALPLEENA